MPKLPKLAVIDLPTGLEGSNTGGEWDSTGGGGDVAMPEEQILDLTMEERQQIFQVRVVSGAWSSRSALDIAARVGGSVCNHCSRIMLVPNPPTRCRICRKLRWEVGQLGPTRASSGQLGPTRANFWANSGQLLGQLGPTND